MTELADLKTRLREMRNAPEDETPESIRVVAGWALDYLDAQAAPAVTPKPAYCCCKCGMPDLTTEGREPAL